MTDSFPKHEREAERQAALEAYDIIDTLPETLFDDIATLAAHLCGTPIAGVTFVDDETQWFKAKVGTSFCTRPRNAAICQDIISTGEPLVIEDLSLHPRWCRSDIMKMGLRFYAGVPIMTADGLPIGTVCVVDVQPQELGDRELALLQALARQVETLLAARLHAQQVRARDQRLQYLEALVHGTSDAMLLVAGDGLILEANESAVKLYGYAYDDLLTRNFDALDLSGPVNVVRTPIADGEAYAIVVRRLAAAHASGLHEAVAA